MESQRKEPSTSFVPVDPFKASLAFSIQNIGPRHAANTEFTSEDIYSRPSAPIYGRSAPEAPSPILFEQINYGPPSPTFIPAPMDYPTVFHEPIPSVTMARPFPESPARFADYQRYPLPHAVIPPSPMVVSLPDARPTEPYPSWASRKTRKESADSQSSQPPHVVVPPAPMVVPPPDARHTEPYVSLASRKMAKESGRSVMQESSGWEQAGRMSMSPEPMAQTTAAASSAAPFPSRRYDTSNPTTPLEGDSAGGLRKFSYNEEKIPRPPSRPVPKKQTSITLVPAHGTTSSSASRYALTPRYSRRNTLSLIGRVPSASPQSPGSSYLSKAQPQTPPTSLATYAHSSEVTTVQSLNDDVSYSTRTYLLAFILDTVPRQVYLHLLLRLPYMYFSRVTRIFEEAEISMPQIKWGILERALEIEKGTMLAQPRGRFLAEESKETLPLKFTNLQNTWQAFIDSLLREWKTLIIISVLLLSAILTVLQLDGASEDPLIRYTALISMICALMSLLYGCIYIIRFGTMQKTYKAAEWANEAQKMRQNIVWNIWVLLAMPVTWLAWQVSIILFIVCVMSFVWRTGTVEDSASSSQGPVTRHQILPARTVVTSVLALGVGYLVLIMATLRRYGEIMDRAWQRRIMGWVNGSDFDAFKLREGPKSPVQEKGTAQAQAHPVDQDKQPSLTRDKASESTGGFPPTAPFVVPVPVPLVARSRVGSPTTHTVANAYEPQSQMHAPQAQTRGILRKSRAGDAKPPARKRHRQEEEIGGAQWRDVTKSEEADANYVFWRPPIDHGRISVNGG